MVVYIGRSSPFASISEVFLGLLHDLLEPLSCSFILGKDWRPLFKVTHGNRKQDSWKDSLLCITFVYVLDSV